MSKKELCRRESAVSSFSEAAKALHKDICTGEPGGATLMLVMRQTHIEFAKLILYQIRWRANHSGKGQLRQHSCWSNGNTHVESALFTLLTKTLAQKGKIFLPRTCQGYS